MIRQVLLLGDLGDVTGRLRIGPQQVREPLSIRQIEDRVHARFAEVGVQKDRPAARLGEDDRQVRGDRRLALTRDGTRNEERPHRPVDRSELDVRAQAPIRLGRGRSWVQERGEAVDLALPPEPLHLRDRAQGRQSDRLLNVVGGLDRVVQVIEQESEAEGDEQPGGRGEDRVEQHAWRSRALGWQGRVDDREEVRAAVGRETECRSVGLAKRDDPALKGLQLLLLGGGAKSEIGQPLDLAVGVPDLGLDCNELGVDELLDLRVAAGDRRRCGDHGGGQGVREGRGTDRVAILDSQLDQG